MTLVNELRRRFGIRAGLMPCAALLVVLSTALLGGCGEGGPAVDQPLSLQTAPSAPAALTLQRFSASCALCHLTGLAGAPRAGNAGDWAPRLAQGRALLLKNTIEGLNRMPPLGYCMSCEASDFVSMIEYMAGLAPGEWAEDPSGEQQ